MSEIQGLPERIGRYEVKGLLGRGGMGRVVRAHDPTLHRDVALKLVEPGAVPPDALAEIRYLFHREARATAQLRHPGIIEIYDYSGPDAELMFIACELVEAPTLRDVLEKRGALATHVATAVAFELTQALAHAHAHGIVHRDVKPENVFWLASGRIILSDFGIAKSLDKQGLGGTVVFGATHVYGSPAYMAPEQLAGAAVGPHTDMHALGAVLYEMLSGRQAFDGPNVDTILEAIQSDSRPSLSGEHGAPRVLVALVASLLSKAPQDRPGAAAAVRSLRDALDALEVSDPRLILRDLGEHTAALETPPQDGSATVLYSSERPFRAPPAKPTAKIWSLGPFVLAALALAALVATGVVLLRRAERPTTAPSGAPTASGQTATADEVFVLLRFAGRATVWVDGREVGAWEGQIRLGLSPGPHTLELRSATGIERREIMLLAGTEPAFDFGPR